MKTYTHVINLDFQGSPGAGELDHDKTLTLSSQHIQHKFTLALDPSEEYKNIPVFGADYITSLYIEPQNTDPVKLYLNGSSDVDAIPIESLYLGTFGATDSDGHLRITSATISNNTTSTVQLCIIITGVISV